MKRKVVIALLSVLMLSACSTKEPDEASVENEVQENQPTTDIPASVSELGFYPDLKVGDTVSVKHGKGSKEKLSFDYTLVGVESYKAVEGDGFDQGVSEDYLVLHIRLKITGEEANAYKLLSPMDIFQLIGEPNSDFNNSPYVVVDYPEFASKNKKIGDPMFDYDEMSSKLKADLAVGEEIEFKQTVRSNLDSSGFSKTDFILTTNRIDTMFNDDGTVRVPESTTRTNFAYHIKSGDIKTK